MRHQELKSFYIFSQLHIKQISLATESIVIFHVMRDYYIMRDTMSKYAKYTLVICVKNNLKYCLRV